LIRLAHYDTYTLPRGGVGVDYWGLKLLGRFHAYGSHVAAAVMMGDPRFITSETAIHVGTCRQNGLFPRGSDQLLTKYNSVIKSYCDTGDPFCCSGLNVLAHLTYTTTYDSAALSFVLGKIGG